MSSYIILSIRRTQWDMHDVEEYSKFIKIVAFGHPNQALLAMKLVQGLAHFWLHQTSAGLGNKNMFGLLVRF